MDGWNEDKLEDVIRVLESLESLTYEVKNCIRGCYTRATTYEELQKYIIRKAERLREAAEYMDIEEDEEEEDEL